MAPGSTQTSFHTWTVRVTTSSIGFTGTGANDSYWPETSSVGYFNGYDQLVVDRRAPALTRPLQLLAWTKAALVNAAAERRQRPCRAPRLAQRRSVARARCCAAHGRWRAAYGSCA